MKRWTLPLILFVEIALFVAVEGPRLDSPAAFVTYFRDYFSDLLAQAAPALLLALGMTLIISTAGIDLSVASQTALIACVMSMFAEGPRFWATAVPLGLLIGVALGLGNGLLIARLDVPPIVATLGTMILYRGLCFAVLGEAENSPFLEVPGYGWLGEFVGTGALLAVAFGAFGLWFHRSRWRRELLMIGGNRVAARYAGIPVTRRLCETYALMGVFAWLAALSFTARHGSMAGSSLTGFELRVIVAVVLGGTRGQGGFAALGGTFFGVLILAALDEGLRGAALKAGPHLPFKLSHLQFVLLGLLLVVAVWFNSRDTKSRRPSAPRAPEASPVR